MFYLQHVIRLNNSFDSDYIPRYTASDLNWFERRACYLVRSKEM